MRVALVHDWLNQQGGAEDVLETLVRMYPGAPVYTSMYAPELMPPSYRQWDIHTTWLDSLPGIHRHHQPYLPLYPLAFDVLRLSGYDMVLSNKSGFCHGVRVEPPTPHICYCLTPTRYVWLLADYVQREGFSHAVNAILPAVVSLLRRWDYAAAQRVDHFIAISTEVRERIRRFYRRESVIIHPPVNTARFRPAARHDDFYLVLSRLVPYKRIDLAVQACRRLGRSLVVAGDGRDRPRLQAMAGAHVTFLGRVGDEQAADLLARCKALLFPGVEDFGITPLQAQAAGRPVIAYAGGGALDSVIEGHTGLLFRQPTAEALAQAVLALDDLALDPASIRAHAASFDVSVFEQKLKAFVRDKLAAS
ncbi:MAG: glycosyltransferase [Thermoflexales bacterium]|nr:glycosyltransferase [Thermoflexales bacterium]